MPPKKKPIDPLQKKIPSNPKYQYVQATIDTGASLTKYLKRVEEIRENYRFRNDELFKRMKISTFVQLVIQVEEINVGAQRDAEEEARLLASGYHRGDSHQDSDDASTVRDESGDEGDESYDRVPRLPPSELSNRTKYSDTGNMATERSSLQSVVRGIGEFDMAQRNQKVEPNKNYGFPDSLPYLLLDIRDRDEYDACHLIKAYSYPHTMLSRSVNFETKEMLACRNQPGKIIVVYDEDERLAPKVATTLFQRGYDNLFLLSGGLKVALKKFPRGLVCGTIPKHLMPPPGTSKQSRNPHTCGITSRSSISSANSVTSTSRGGGIGSAKLFPGGDTVSVHSSASQRENVVSISPEDSPMRDQFTAEDLEELSAQLDYILATGDASSVASSRVQSRGTARSTISSASQVDPYDRKPFKV